MADSSTDDDSLRTLKQRYVKGEITKKKYEEMKKEIMGGDSSDAGSGQRARPESAQRQTSIPKPGPVSQTRKIALGVFLLLLFVGMIWLLASSSSNQQGSYGSVNNPYSTSQGYLGQGYYSINGQSVYISSQSQWDSIFYNYTTNSTTSIYTNSTTTVSGQVTSLPPACQPGECSVNLTSTYCTRVGTNEEVQYYPNKTDTGIYNIGETGTAKLPVYGVIEPEGFIGGVSDGEVGAWGDADITCGDWTYNSNESWCIREPGQPNSTTWSGYINGASGYEYGIAPGTSIVLTHEIFMNYTNETWTGGMKAFAPINVYANFTWYLAGLGYASQDQVPSPEIQSASVVCP